jgi:hypothetical protein
LKKQEPRWEVKGREEGELNAKLAIAANLLEILDDATIAGKTGLTLEQVAYLTDVTQDP